MERVLYYMAQVFNSKTQAYNCKANDVGALHNEWRNPLHAYRRSLTNHLHGKAAELCLTNS